MMTTVEKSKEGNIETKKTIEEVSLALSTQKTNENFVKHVCGYTNCEPALHCTDLICGTNRDSRVGVYKDEAWYTVERM